MPTNATVTATNPYGDSCPSGSWLTALLNILNNYTNVSVPDPSSGSGPVTLLRQSNPPTVANGTYWKRISTDGVTPKPLGEYAPFNGRWVPANPPPIGTIIPFTGNPTGLFTDNGFGLFTPTPDTPGIAGTWYGWQLTNNLNGSRNFKNSFLIAAEKWDSDAGAWVAKIPKEDGTFEYQVSGGKEDVMLANPQLPNMAVREFSEGGAGAFTAIYGGNQFVATTDGDANPREDQVAQEEIADNYPPFKAVAFLQFVGYGAIGT